LLELVLLVVVDAEDEGRVVGGERGAAVQAEAELDHPGVLTVEVAERGEQRRVGRRRSVRRLPGGVAVDLPQRSLHPPARERAERQATGGVVAVRSTADGLVAG